MGSLDHYSNNSNRLNNTTVAEFLDEGEWDLNKLIQQFLAEKMAAILHNEIPVKRHLPDQAIQTLNAVRNFTCSSNFNEIREKRNKNQYQSQIWNKCVPFNISFLLSRILKSKLPTNDRLITLRIETVNCFCWRNRRGEDNINHIINSGPFARTVWTSFAGLVGIRCNHQSLPQLIANWWNTQSNNESHKLILQDTLILIYWNLWKSRCTQRYGGNPSNMNMVKYVMQ